MRLKTVSHQSRDTASATGKSGKQWQTVNEYQRSYCTKTAVLEYYIAGRQVAVRGHSLPLKSAIYPSVHFDIRLDHLECLPAARDQGETPCSAGPSKRTRQLIHTLARTTITRWQCQSSITVGPSPRRNITQRPSIPLHSLCAAPTHRLEAENRPSAITLYQACIAMRTPSMELLMLLMMTMRVDVALAAVDAQPAVHLWQAVETQLSNGVAGVHALLPLRNDGIKRLANDKETAVTGIQFGHGKGRTGAGEAKRGPQTKDVATISYSRRGSTVYEFHDIEIVSAMTNRQRLVARIVLVDSRCRLTHPGGSVFALVNDRRCLRKMLRNWRTGRYRAQHISALIVDGEHVTHTRKQLPAVDLIRVNASLMSYIVKLVSSPTAVEMDVIPAATDDGL